ncbi:MAG: hypothetical protein IH946_12030, partial [Bacteroidetes bacterium]|nr:hypothetical protein [Bacteroidota bacterium]
IGLNLKYLSFILFILFIPPDMLAQTCCSGGVPIASNLGLSGTQYKTIQMLISYDYNVMHDLYLGKRHLDDDTRYRSTHSLLLEGSYGFHKRWSATVMLSAVRQERTINVFGTQNLTVGQGLGDAVILIKYNLLEPENRSGREIVIGAGPKIPLGASDLTNDIGIILPADLQAGSGSLDGILWGSFSQYRFI